MSILKYKRTRMDEQKWREIKELEKDYDLFISDEFAQQISDIQMHMTYLQDMQRMTTSAKRQSLLLKDPTAIGSQEKLNRNTLNTNSRDEQKRTYSVKKRTSSVREVEASN